MNWKYIKFREFIAIQRGHDLPSTKRTNGIYPVVGSAGINGYHNVFKASSPGVTIGRSGASIGKAFYIDQPFWPHNACLYVKDFKGNNEKFVYYFLKINDFSYLNSGSAQPSLNRNILYNLTIKIPSRITQTKIATILSAYDDLIENNNQRIQLLEEMAEEIYKEWFVRLRFSGYQECKYFDKEGKEVERGNDGALPEGWEKVKLGTLCEIQMGQSPKSEFYNENKEGLPFHQGVTNFKNRFPIHKIYCTELKRIAEESDILLSVRAPVGRINFSNTKLVIGRGLCSIKDKNGNQNYLFYVLKDIFKHEDSFGNGAVFNSVSKGDLEKIPAFKPSYSRVQTFQKLIKPIDDEIKILAQKNQLLQETRDLLLPRLISGKLSVEKI